MYPIALQLIQKNIEVLEARLMRAVQSGQPSPIALIYDVACPLGQRVISALNALDPDVKNKADVVIAGTEDGYIPIHIAVMGRLMMGDLIADALHGSVADSAIVKKMVELIASPCGENTFPILSIARKVETSLSECEVVSLLHTIGDPMQ